MSTQINTSKTHKQISYRKHNTKLTNSVFYSSKNTDRQIPFFKTFLGLSQLICAFAHSLAYIAVKRLDVKLGQSSRTHVHMGLFRVWVVVCRLDRGQTELYDVMFGMSMGAYIGHRRVCARSVLYNVRLSLYAWICMPRGISCLRVFGVRLAYVKCWSATLCVSFCELLCVQCV